MGLPPSEQDPAAVRDLADRILAEARYDRPPEPIVRTGPRAGSASRSPRRSAAWSAAGAARSWRGSSSLAADRVASSTCSVRYGRVSLPALADAREPEVMVELTRSAEEWRAEAERSEAEGRWAEGLRCRHRALVADLVRRGAIPEQAGRTAGEYVRDVARSLPDAAPRWRPRPPSCSRRPGTAEPPRAPPRRPGSRSSTRGCWRCEV